MERKSGVLMHVSSLWGEYSVGSFGRAAREWIDLLQRGGFSYWQTLPFCLPDDANSPYKSYSTFSVNPNFIDLGDLYERGLITSEELLSAEQKTPYGCEFERLREERILLLSRAAERFDAWDRTDAFFEEHPGCAEFCTFMGLCKKNGSANWSTWAEAEPDGTTVRLWKFIIYIFFEQWREIKAYANERGIRIIGDVPIYVAWDSSDVYFHPEEFLLDPDGLPSSVAGVPPDYFSEDGQLWGNPLYNFAKMKKNGYRFWRERISFMAELFDGVRIDHFRALEAFYAIPRGAETAKEGKWNRGPGLSLIKALREAAGDCFLIAEDLGTITEEVDRLRKQGGLPGMRVLQFGFLEGWDSPHLPHAFAADSVAYTGTHDNNTLLGYLWELDDATRRRVLSYFGCEGLHFDDRRVYREILRQMLASPAELVIFPVQDLLLYGSDTRFNTPGRSVGNWGYRVTRDQAKSIDTEAFYRWNEMYGRI